MTRIFRKSRFTYGAPLTAIAVSAMLLTGGATATNAGHGTVPGAVLGAGVGYGVGGKKGIIPGLIGGALIGSALSSRSHASPPPPPPSYASPPPPPAPIYNNRLVYNIQFSLTQLGYSPGPIDGVYGRLTADAIGAYEYNNQLAVTAQPSPGLYDHMQRAGG